MAERRTLFQCEECGKWFFSMEVFIRHGCVTASAAGSQDAGTSADEAGIVLPTFNDECTEKEIEKQIEIQEQQEEDLKWSRSATLLMLSEYKKRQSRVDEGKLKKKKAFEEISKVLRDSMYLFSADQCATRMKTITRAYKQTKDHNKKSGNSRKEYAYEKDLDELFGDQPNVNPVFVLSSQQQNADAGNSTVQTDAGGAVEPPEPEPPQVGKKRKESNSPDEEDDDDDENLCKICMEKPACTAFVECGHIVCCIQCCQTMDACPICRQVIKTWLRVFQC